MPSRRSFLSSLIAAGAGTACFRSGFSAENPTLITPETKTAIQSGLRWLTDQQHTNGAFGSVARHHGNPGIAGLAGLAIAALVAAPPAVVRVVLEVGVEGDDDGRVAVVDARGDARGLAEITAKSHEAEPRAGLGGGVQKLEARIEAFNALNWFRPLDPVTSLSSPVFGRVQTSADPRIFQFAVKYVF